MAWLAKDLRGEIGAQLYRAAEDLGAPPDLLAVIGSYGDTLPDEDVLSLLTDFNEGGRVFKTVIAAVADSD